MNSIDSSILNNLQIPGIVLPDTTFEKRYIECRAKEKRIYTDDELLQLPDCSPAHPHYKEWKLRKASCKKLVSYLTHKKKPLHILEIGCGNGWLLHQLSGISRSKLMGLDVNFTELQQAARVFSDQPKIKFVYGDIRSGILEKQKFDIIIFAASIQYFRSPDDIIETCLRQLQPDGEIHITDTKFYLAPELAAARKRSGQYFYSLGFPEMERHYFHHSLRSLQSFHYSVLHEPRQWLGRFIKDYVPFHWIRIKKNGN